MPGARRRGGRGRRRRVVPQLDRRRDLRGKGFGQIAADLRREGWVRELQVEEFASYCFLCLVADRDGVSFYRRSRIGEELGLDEQQVYRALRRLIELDLVAYAPFHPGAADGFHQVLSLPVRRAAPSDEALIQDALSQLQRRFRAQ